jgi:hypothetical protein
VSRQAIAAALACEHLSAGERLVAFSLASFADRENRAWPGAPAAAARAGLRRSRYLEAREQLVRRGLVIVEQAATGRGRCSRLALRFAIDGPWYEAEINAGLFEAVLGYSSARGPARVLLAAMAALADGEGFVEDLSTEQLCVAAGLADRTYRRARQALLASGELILLSGVGGRGHTNRWHVLYPRRVAGEPRRPSSGRRVVPPAGARPLVVAHAKPRPQAPPTEVDAVVAGVAEVSGNGNGDVGSVKGGQGRTLSPVNRPVLTGVCALKGGQDRTLSAGNCPVLTGVSAGKGGQDRTLFDPDGAKTPAETPAETPAPNARGGRNPRTPEPKQHPPSPPEGGSSHESITIEETYLTDRGRRRRRRVNVNLDEVRRTLGVPGPADHAAWQRTRELLVERVGESTFEIWLDAVGMVAVDTDDGALVLDGPDGTRSWVRERYGGVIADCAELAGATVRFASEAQVVAVGAR